MSSLLLSPLIAETYGERIRAVCKHAGLRVDFVVLDSFNSGKRVRLEEVELAFLSPDYMGESSNPATNVALAGFLQAVADAKRLDWLHICSAGADRPQLQKLMSRGVKVTTSAGANALAVAHTAMAAALAFAREVPHWVRSTELKQWAPRRGDDSPRDFDGSRAVIVGTGSIGREIARLCKAFGLQVTGVRRTLAEVPHCDAVVGFADLATALHDADWLFLACPLTDQTRGLIDLEMLKRLPSHAKLINVARGSVVKEDELALALSTGVIGGAYSDVFSVEPLPDDSPLWGSPNFVLSAHSAGPSRGFADRTAEIFLENLSRWARREPLLNPAIAA